MARTRKPPPAFNAYYTAAEDAAARFAQDAPKDRWLAAWAYCRRMQWLRAEAHLPPVPALTEEQFERFYQGR